MEISFEQYREPITTATRGHSQLFQQVTAQLDVHSPHGQGLATTNHQIQAIHNTVLESLITKHQEVFADGLGKVKNFTKLHVSPDAQPCYYRP